MHQDNSVAVFSKPASIPVPACEPSCSVTDLCDVAQVHPVGRFRHNSLMYILAKEHGFTQLHGACLLV